MPHVAPISVNGEIIIPESIVLELRFMQDQYNQNGEIDLGLVQNRIIERLLLDQEARKRGIQISREQFESAFQKAVEPFGGKQQYDQAMRTHPENGKAFEARLLQNIRITELKRILTRNVKSPASDKVSAYYRNHPDEFSIPARIHARHIVVHTERTDEPVPAVLNQCLSRLSEGEDFGTLADRFSDCPGQGGDLGTFPRGVMVPEFDAVAFSLKKGEVSAPFRTSFGYHLVHVLDIFPERMETFDEVKNRISHKLEESKRNNVMETFVKALWKRAAIRIVTYPNQNPAEVS